MDFLDIFLDKEKGQPLYRQLYSELGGRVREGRLAAGTRLPGKRQAAGQLGVSVNTVDTAYQMLAAEGYIQARPKSGFYVCRLQRQLVPPPAPPAEGRETGEAGGTGGPRELLEAHEAGWRYSFATGGLDTALFPRKTWARLLREVMAGPADLFARGPGMGEAPLQKALAEYLQGYRGVRCTAQQIVIGAGLEVLVGMLARLMPKAVFGLESPGYPKTGHILANMGLGRVAVPVDEGGMRPEALLRSGAGVAYVTPSHQFPTGAVMPAPRRSQMLNWAAEKGRLLIEDDYDSEFRFDGRPLPCLQGLDTAGSVVYAGTFSRSLAPGLRAAYLVLPPRLLAAWQAAYADYACTVGRPEQHTLARMMEEGHFARSLNRARAAYRSRRNALLDALAEALPKGAWRAENTHTGLYFILRLPGRNAPTLARAARAAGLRLRALAEYLPPEGQAAREWQDALVLGYGGLPGADAPAAARLLAGVVQGGAPG